MANVYAYPLEGRERDSAKFMWDTYRKAVTGKSSKGFDLPEFDNLMPFHQYAWLKVAKATNN